MMLKKSLICVPIFACLCCSSIIILPVFAIMFIVFLPLILMFSITSWFFFCFNYGVWLRQSTLDRLIRYQLLEGQFRTHIWRFIYDNLFTNQKRQEEITSLNLGFALLNLDGIFLEDHRNDSNVLQYQLYHYAIEHCANIKSMKDKVFLEIGCGRGGCMKYVSQTFKPRQAYGVDISH